MTATTPSTQVEAVSLADLLDRVVDRGVVLSGELVIGLADVDLIYLNLRLLLQSVERSASRPEGER